MKKNTNVSFLLFLLLVSLFVSCKNFINSIIDSTPETESQSVESQTEKKYATITGAITVEGAVPSEIADALSGSKNAESNTRSAGITYTASDYTFYIHATNSSGSSPADVDASSGTFTINLEYGTWTLYAYAKTKNNSDGKTYFKSASYTQVINEDCSILSHDFVVRPMTGGKGKILLRLFTSNGIDVFTYCIGIPGVNSSGSLTGISGGGKTYSTLSVDTCPSGSYTVQFIFKDGSDDIKYATTQVINVYDGFTTDTWIDNGGNDGLISGGEFTLTTTQINNFAMSTFFVDGVNGKDSYSGTWVKPVKTIAKAVATARKTSGTKNVYVKAGGSEEVTAYIYIDKNMNLEVYTDTIGDKQGKYTLKRSSSFTDKSIISINGYSSSSITVSLTGLVVDGNSVTTSVNGAGINNNQYGTLTLNNCVMLKNKVASGYSGGGVYNLGNLTISGSTCLDEVSDIYLASGKTIAVSNLNPKDKDGSSVNTTAYLTLQSPVLTPTPTSVLTSTTNLNVDAVSKFTVTNDGKKYCVKVNPSDAKKGILAERGANGNVAYAEEKYSLSIDNSIKLPNVEATVNLTVKDSDGNSVNPTSCSLKLCQNGEAITSVESTTATITLPAWLPEGTYIIKAEVVINGFRYDKEFAFSVGVVPVARLTSAPTASTCPQVSMNTSAELTKIKTWIDASSDFEGVTITLSDNVDATSLTDWEPIGSLEKPFKGTFDGNGKSITFNITRKSDSDQYATLVCKNEGIIDN